MVAKAFSQWRPCSKGHTYDVYLVETGSWDTGCTEIEEDIDRSQPTLFYHESELEAGRKIAIHRKIWRKARRLLRRRGEECVDSR